MKVTNIYDIPNEYDDSLCVKILTFVYDKQSDGKTINTKDIRKEFIGKLKRWYWPFKRYTKNEVNITILLLVKLKLLKIYKPIKYR